MGYAFMIIALLVLIPVVFILLSRRGGNTGGIRSDTKTTMRDEPSSDQPTPRADPTVNQASAEVGRRLPPG